MPDTILKLEGITAGYGRGAVIHQLDLQADRGEVVALLGTNGAGKTTTLRVASGAVRPTAGTVTFAGHDIAGTAPHTLARQGIAHVPEGRGIFFGLTVAEHFKLGYRGEHLDASEAYEYFPALSDLRNQRAGLLSGGEQQMLALGRALARHPKLLLLDELSLGLAPIIVESLLPIVRKVADTSAAAILLVEQYAKLALEVADRGYVLSQGKIVLHGPATDLRKDHDLIVASYLGDTRTAAVQA